VTGEFQLRLLRRAARRLAQMAHYRRLSLAGTPVLFANSFPKSGTHLLTQVMAGFTRLGPAVLSGLPAVVTFEGDTGRQRAEAEILSDLQRLLPGDIAYGHVHALPGAVDLLCQPRFVAYFILRDPRDVVVSHVHYLTEMKKDHIHHHYYQEVLKTFDERLAASIQGVKNSNGVTLPNILARFEPFLGWLNRPEVLTLRYEDFITNREPTLRRVLDHAIQRGFPSQVEPDQAVQILSEAIDPKRSPTFRSGKAGGWTTVFNGGHKRLFKEITGDLLLRLGYTENQDW